MPDKIITIAIFENSFDAAIAKQSLEEAGINCSVVGETGAHVYSGLSAVNRIELQVFEKDADKAIEILSEKPESFEQQEENE